MRGTDELTIRVETYRGDPQSFSLSIRADGPNAIGARELLRGTSPVLVTEGILAVVREWLYTLGPGRGAP